MSQSESFDQSHAITIPGGGPGVPGRELHPGDIIGGSYKLKSLVARGGMGYVFCAVHTIIDHEYALKMLAPEVLNETNRKRFESEGRAIGNLDHVNIVKVYNMGLDVDGSPFYVMDLLDGRTLARCIYERDNFTLEQCLDILSQIAAGLNYAHSKGIVHRDVKPSNIILLKEKDGRNLVKIVDFGLAKVVSSASLHQQSQTKIGEVFGSPFYMSPEQCEGRAVDARSDIYSLGCTFFQMLTGAPPFHGKNHMETMQLHQTEKVPSAIKASSIGGLPLSIDVLLAKMLAKRPVERYQTMEQLMHDIGRIRSGKAIGRPGGVGTATGTDTNAVGVASSTSVNAATLSSVGLNAIKSVEDSEPAEAANDKRWDPLPLYIAAGAVVLSALAVGIWHLCFNKAVPDGAKRSITAAHPTGRGSGGGAKEDVPAFDAVPGAGEVEHQGKATETAKAGPTGDYQAALASFSNFGPIKSTRVTKGGLKGRMFKFPTWSIGTISMHPDWSQEAEGPVVVPGLQPLALEIGQTPKSKQVLNVPYIFDQIGADEFSYLSITGTDSTSVVSALEGGASEAERVLHMLKRAAHWTQLKGLVLNGISLDKGILDAINDLKNLQTLEFHTCKVKNNAELVAQPFLTRLDTIIFYQGQDLDPLVGPLSRSNKLHQLHLVDCSFSPAAMAQLAQSPGLKILRLYLPKGSGKYRPPELMSLSAPAAPSRRVNVAEMTDALVQIKTLEKITFHDALLSLEQIKKITACPNVRSLDLSVDKISPAVQKKCRQSEPKVTFTNEPRVW